jgi:hypothetical protein
MKNSYVQARQRGFAHVGMIIITVVVLAVGGIAAWRVMNASKSDSASNAQKKQIENLISGPLTPEDQQRVEDAAAQATNETSDGAAAGSGSTSAGRASQTAPSPPRNTTSTPTASTPPAQSSTPTNNNTQQSTSPYTRPTAAFCQQKNGEKFDAWVTDNSNHTYTVWENGGWVNKSSTGTAARNYDTMHVVGVIPYLTKPSWTHCSDKSGYVMAYYQPPGSVYTYNWLVAFEHVTVVEP